MSIWLQHLLVLTLVAACVLGVLWQVVRTLRGAGRLGSCCARGCGAADAKPRQDVQRLVVIPADSIRLPRRR